MTEADKPLLGMAVLVFGTLGRGPGRYREWHKAMRVSVGGVDLWRSLPGCWNIYDVTHWQELPQEPNGKYPEK